MKLIKMAPLSLMGLFIITSCSDSGPGSGSTINQNEIEELDGSNVQGNYAALIWPMNYNLHFQTIGAVGLRRDGDDFSATIALKYGPKGTTVRSALYTGRRCPNLSDDLNKDAYVDIFEARLAMGKITIPFDGDLDSQMGGRGQYPTVNSSGKMFYSGTASFSRMFEDLREADENPSDQIIKLKENEGITFPGRIVLLQGIPKRVDLPETVATTGGESAHASMPVGCAVIWKVNEMPAELVEMENGNP